MSDTIRKQWRVLCETDGIVYTYALTEPTQCPINPAHTVLAVNLWNENPSLSSLVGCVVDVDESKGNYTSISNAFADGNTNVFVRNGTYIETTDIILSDRCKLIGETPGDVVIVLMAGARLVVDGSDGIQETSGTIDLTTNSVAIVGTGTTFTNLNVGDFIQVANTYYAIDSITDDTNLTILNAYRGKSVTGVNYVAQSMHAAIIIQNFVITGSSDTGILFRACRFSHVANFALTKNVINLYIISCGDCSFSKFSVTNSLGGTGICIENSFDLSFDSVNVINNASNGIEILNNSNHISFDSCYSTSNNGCGILVDSSDHISISDVTIKQNDDPGIRIINSASEVNVNSCDITDNTIGIDVQTSNNTISGCNIDHNDTGIACIAGNNINNSIICNNKSNGVELSGNNSIFTGNTISSNGGFGVQNTADNCIISGNMINNNTLDGVEITSIASDTIVTGNNMKSNIGINFKNSSISTVTANNITI